MLSRQENSLTLFPLPSHGQPHNAARADMAEMPPANLSAHNTVVDYSTRSVISNQYKETLR